MRKYSMLNCLLKLRKAKRGDTQDKKFAKDAFPHLWRMEILELNLLGL